MDQARHDVRFDWGLCGLLALRECRTFVIVDVLSFSTAVAVALARGAAVLPFPFDDPEGARALARDNGALLAEPRGARSGYSLSPASLLTLPLGAKLVLPSPNGSRLSARAASLGRVLSGCLRNAAAVAALARASEGPIAVIAAGEHWPDGSLRPCFEDLVGAGAIIARLPGSRSAEAMAAHAAFAACEARLEALLLDSASGRELVARGFSDDVGLAAALDVTPVAPELRSVGFVGAGES